MTRRVCSAKRSLHGEAEFLASRWCVFEDLPEGQQAIFHGRAPDHRQLALVFIGKIEVGAGGVAEHHYLVAVFSALCVNELSRPDLCTYREVRCDIITAGPGEGRTLVTPEGRTVTAAQEVDARSFYTHCLETLRR